MDQFSDQIGERLRLARESADLTVDDIVFQTRIPRSVVVALEAADFSVFSSPTYAKSFLAQYSGFLNIDAGMWLDALQPANFVGNQFVNPLCQAVMPEKDQRPIEPAAPSGWLSTLVLLGVTCGVVFAAIRGYEFFESRFGVELNMNDLGKKEEAVQQVSPMTVAPSVQAVPPAVTPDTRAIASETASKKRDDDLVQPPPRAIIVR